MVKYNVVDAIFKKHKCTLLMSEEEFNLKKRFVKEKYKYIASCGHHHEKLLDTFKHRSQGVNCPKCVLLKQSINQTEKCKLNPLSNLNLEHTSLVYFRNIIKDKFDIKINGEACLADCCIKPKNITEDLWLMVQMKSTAKPRSKSYCFDCHSNYINCIIMCICASDEKMWVFDGNTIITKNISIGLGKSKYDEFEITTDTIHDKLTYYYNTLPKYDFETIDTPINPQHKLEREYRIYRETMIPCINFIRNERHGLVYDFIINGLKIQEKVCSKKKNRNGTEFHLNKSNGKVDRIHQMVSYQKGDNDFYWLNVNDKKYFYIIPEDELIIRNYINVDKTTTITLTPNSKKGNNIWANEYLFDYTNITEIDEQKLKKMFQLEN